MRPLVAGVLICAAALAPACGSDPPPLEAAVDIAADEGAFGNGPEAGESLARIAQHLEAARRGCDTDENAARCRALGAASGYAQVLAVQVLRCTAPGRFEAHRAMHDLLVRVAAVGPDDEVPVPAPLPDCT